MREPTSNTPGSGSKGRQTAPARRGPQREDDEIFISEVNEELQREQLSRIARVYGPYILGAIVALIIGVAVFEYNRSASLEAATLTGERLIEAEAQADPSVFEALGDDLDEAGVVAQLRAAALLTDGLLDDDDPARADAIYATIVANEDAAPRYRDLAILRRAMLNAEEQDPQALIDALAPATLAGRPYRALALELSAAAYLRTGDAETAQALLIEARDDISTFESARARLNDQINALEDLSLDDRDNPTTPQPQSDEIAPAPEAED